MLRGDVSKTRGLLVAGGFGVGFLRVEDDCHGWVQDPVNERFCGDIVGHHFAPVGCPEL